MRKLDELAGSDGGVEKWSQSRRCGGASRTSWCEVGVVSPRVLVSWRPHFNPAGHTAAWEQPSSASLCLSLTAVHFG